MRPDLFGLTPTQRQVLETIWRRGSVPRNEIAQLTGLTTASITRLAQDLEGLGLVFDTVKRDGGRGQPVRPLSISPDGAFALGVNFSHSYIDAGLVNAAGDLVAKERAPLERATPAAVGAFAIHALPRLCAEAKIPLAKVIGIGFSMPGDFVSPNRLNPHAFFPDFSPELDLLEILSAGSPVEVVIENDALSAAIGERVHGAGAAFDDFLFVHIGHGVGSGILLNGKPYRGAHGNAGVIGVAYPNDRPRPSGQDLFAALAEAGLEARDFDALEALGVDHPVIDRWLKRAGAQLAEGLQQPVRLLDPQTVILGGRLPQPLLEALYRYTPLSKALGENAPLPAPPFTLSTLGPYAGVIGAASVCFFRSFFAHS